MAYNLDHTVPEGLDTGHVEAAEFRQIEDGAWTVLCMFRAEGFSHDQGMIVGRMGSATNARWFEVRTTMGAAPQSVETLTADFVSQIVGAASIQTGTWYLVAVTNDAASPNATLTQYVFELDGTAIDDGLTASDAWEGTDDTVANTIGVRQDDGDPFDGDVAYSAYIRQELTRSEILSYLSDPDAFIAGLPTADVVWYHVLDDLVDDGPNGNDVTTIGTPTQVAGPTFGGGGTAESRSDLARALDSVGDNLAALVTTTDTVSAGDAVGIQVSISEQVTDTASAVDSVSETLAGQISEALSESVRAGDTVTLTLSAVESLSDVVGTQDLAGVGLTLPLPDEKASAQDTASATLAAREETSDSASARDAVNTTLSTEGKIVESVTDRVIAADSPAGSLAAVEAITDGVVATDRTGDLLSALEVVVEAAVAGDTVSVSVPGVDAAFLSATLKVLAQYDAGIRVRGKMDSSVQVN